MSNETEQRKLAAIMFTDMVGYSALSQRDDRLALELLEEHRALLREIFPRFHGTEIKTIGDAFLVEFNSALEAAQCAIEIQRTLAKRNHDVTAEHRIELKIGIHIGDVVHRAGDVYGDGVNIASRIEPLAGAGGICVSMDVERQIRNALETRFEKLAPTELKNIAAPMDLFRIVLPWEKKSEDRGQLVRRSLGEGGKSDVKRKAALISAFLLLLIVGIGWWWTTLTHKNTASAPATAPSSPAQQISDKSIAVLPFENLSQDKANAFFASGIQEEILTRLAKIGALKVISRSSTQQYQSKPASLSEIGKQLGVAHILEGSVQKVGNAVHINVQLIKAATDTHIWAESYNRKLDDIFAVEGEVASAIAEQLNAKLSGSEKQELAQKPTDNPVAYEAYLRGLTQIQQPNVENTAAAVSSFEEAVRLDPKFALAWAALCHTHALAYLNYVDRSLSRREDAERSVAEAVRLQPQLAETQLARAGYQYCFLHDYKGARELLQQLRMIWPSNAEIVQLIGYISARLGEFEKSAKYLHQAIALNPRDAFLRRTTAEIHLGMRDFATAMRMADEGQQIWPDNVEFGRLKVTIFQSRGELDQAQAIAHRLRSPLREIYQAKLQRSAPPADALQACERFAENPGAGFTSAEVLTIAAELLEFSADKSRSQALLAKVRDQAEASLKRQPDNWPLVVSRACALAGLGERSEALRAADQAIALTANDARDHGRAQEMKARLQARFGDKDAAIQLLQHLLGISYDGAYGPPLTPVLLRLDSDFDSLRGDPRFQQLLAGKELIGPNK